MIVKLTTCERCGAALLTEPGGVDAVGLHESWHDHLDANADVTVNSSAEVESVITEIVEESRETVAEDDGDEHGPIDRHPQIPEAAWRTLNREQRLDVDARMVKIAKRQEKLADREAHPDDIVAARKYLEAGVEALRSDYGIELLDPAEIERADAAIPADEPPPAPVRVDSAPVPARELVRRRRYLLAKQGLPGEAEEARVAELEEIDRRLRAQGTPA